MIDKTAIINNNAKIHSTAKIGPFTVIGPNVEIDENVTIHSHVNISGNTKIGKGNTFYPFASIGNDPQDLKFNGEIFLSNEIFNQTCEITDFYFLTLVRDLMITNSTYSLWAAYLKNHGKIFFPKPFYPYPLHKSILRHNLEDIIFPNWIPYKVIY